MLPFKLYYWDLETYANCFLFTGKFEGASEHQVFEISDRVNQRNELMSWLSYLQNAGVAMVGYNSIGFDYCILHELLVAPYTFTAAKAYQLAQTIIGSQTYGQNPNAIRLTDRIIPQIDLVKINHFDNANRRTSLKSLQFAMRSESVEDLPYDPSIALTSEQMDHLRSYNLHDVTETEKFGNKCKHLIEMRQELLDNGVLSGDVLNYSDVKIGTEYLIRKIGRSKCFITGSKPKQSPRQFVEFKKVILPKISFRTEPFNEVLDWFKKQVIFFEKEERPHLETSLAGIPFKFGIGGVHASVEGKRYYSNETHVIKDIDVSGMYVAIGVANGFYPEHLGQDFVTAYKQLQADRKHYPKGSSMNAVLKLAGNGVYGNSNNSYSCFYDPKYTFSVTVNGQLQLLQLAELLSLIPGLELIQANTDGITALVPRNALPFFDLWKTDWELSTGLKLEEVEYSSMVIRDVNNYLAITTDGKVKRKGAYWYPESDKDFEGYWNKDYSNLAAIKGVEQVLINGAKPEEIVYLITNPFDFMLRYKTPAGAKVFIGDKEMLKTVRYYVSTAGQPMKKVAVPKGEIGAWKRRNGLKDEFFKKILAEIPPGTWDERIHTKNKSKYETVVTSIESGRLIKECNKASDFNWNDVDYDYYIKEIEKLVI
jgi:hypothetical protein